MACRFCEHVRAALQRAMSARGKVHRPPSGLKVSKYLPSSKKGGRASKPPPGQGWQEAAGRPKGRGELG
jgi:hypothetical protein